MTTVKQLKDGAVLSNPIYIHDPYVIIAKEGNILDAGTLEEMKAAWSYYDDCEVDIRRHDLYHSNIDWNKKV